MADIFATAINCMDGRVQIPVTDYMKRTCGVDHIDMVTEPGVNKVLADKTDTDTVAAIKNKVEISVHAHGSRIVAVAAHHDCAGNPVPDDIQKEQLRKAVETVLSWDLPVDKVFALWLGDSFVPELVC